MRPGGQAAQGGPGMGAVSGERMEPAIKHTYVCGTDEWFTEEVCVLPHVPVRARRRAATLLAAAARLMLRAGCAHAQTEVSIASRSFAQGGMRKCYKCVEKCVEGPKVYSVESVAKFSMIHRDAHSARKAAFADAKMQMVAEYWAQQFNMKSPPQHKVSFVVAQVLELPARQGPARWSSLEPLLSGEYAKFNNNAGAVLGGRLAQAFSHFTVHESSNQLCICDLQGVGGSLFTDPQIHSTSGSYGDGNLGRNGIGSFLATHSCNEVCAALGLPKVEPKMRGHPGGGGMMQPMMGGGMMEGMGGEQDLLKLMRGGMGGGAGMTMPMQRIMEKMMQQLRGGNAQVFVNGVPVHGGGGRVGGGGGAVHRDGRGGGNDIRAALRASEKAAQEEEQRNLRQALKASAGGGGGARRGCARGAA